MSSPATHRLYGRQRTRKYLPLPCNFYPWLDDIANTGYANLITGMNNVKGDVLYAFVLPAFTPQERRVALPLGGTVTVQP